MNLLGILFRRTVASQATLNGGRVLNTGCQLKSSDHVERPPTYGWTRACISYASVWSSGAAGGERNVTHLGVRVQRQRNLPVQ